MPRILDETLDCKPFNPKSSTLISEPKLAQVERLEKVFNSFDTSAP